MTDKEEAAKHLRKIGKELAEKYPKHASAEVLANEAADRLEKPDDVDPEPPPIRLIHKKCQLSRM